MNNSERRELYDPKKTQYTVEDTQQLAVTAIEQIQRNLGNHIRQCLVWNLLLAEMTNNARTYWTNKYDKNRTDMPPEIDREIMASGLVSKVRQGAGSFYIYVG